METRLKSVWIAGAGYLGRPLAQQLGEEGWQVTASSRRPQTDLTWHYWHLQDAQTLQTFQQAATWVILLPPSSAPDYVIQMAHLCEQAQRAQVQQVIYTSSTSVYGSQARLCDENSVLSCETESAQKVAACEEIWLNSGLPQVKVLRLGGLYDDERHPVKHLSARVGLQGGKHVVNVLHRQHALMALHRALTQAQPRIVNVVERQHPTRATFYTAEALRLGLPVPLFDDSDDSLGKTIISLYQHQSF